MKIGRGHDSDLRIPDISVSRLHASIRRDSRGNVIVEDNTSKFGTLMLVKQPLLLERDMVYYVQSGRTIMKLQVMMEWSIFSGFMHGPVDASAIDLHTHIGKKLDIFEELVGQYCK